MKLIGLHLFWTRISNIISMWPPVFFFRHSSIL